jgi:hypothetical protein
LPTEFAHDFDGAWVAVFRIATGSGPRNPELGMPPADPVNDDNRFMGGIIQVDHDFMDQNVN